MVRQIRGLQVPTSSVDAFRRDGPEYLPGIDQMPGGYRTASGGYRGGMMPVLPEYGAGTVQKVQSGQLGYPRVRENRKTEGRVACAGHIGGQNLWFTLAGLHLLEFSGNLRLHLLD